MVHLDATLAEKKDIGEKGLKGGALGLFSSVVVGVASTAPAYSLAATLGFVVIAINGLGAPIITILAFIPMLFISYAYKELNYADPDCGTTFTWGARAFGPKTGWLGGWGIVAADILVMASLAQIAGQYVFLLFGAGGIGTNPSSGWVLLVGIMWIVLMTAICYVGIEVSANMQKVLLGIELTILLVFAVVALLKVGTGHAPPGHLTPSAEWFNPFHHLSFTSFMVGFTLMLFIYWGWDTSVSVNEETRDSHRTPGRAAVLSTVDPAGDLCPGGHGLAVLRRRRHPRHRPGQPQQLGRRDQRARDLGVRHVGDRVVHDQAAPADGAELGGGLDADHHPADGADDLVDGDLQGDPVRRSGGCTSASSPPRSRPSQWASSPLRSTWR